MHRVVAVLGLLLLLGCSSTAPADTASPAPSNTKADPATAAACSAQLQALNAYLAYPYSATASETADRMSRQSDVVSAQEAQMKPENRQMIKASQVALDRLKVLVSAGASEFELMAQYKTWASLGATEEFEAMCHDAGSPDYASPSP